MSDFWNVNEDVNEEGASITVNGSTSEVEVGASFKDEVIGAARDAGLGKFRVFVNGTETDPSKAPETFEAGMEVELKPYEEAGM